jgi:hypothetical protein
MDITPGLKFHPPFLGKVGQASSLSSERVSASSSKPLMVNLRISGFLENYGRRGADNEAAPQCGTRSGCPTACLAKRGQFDLPDLVMDLGGGHFNACKVDSGRNVSKERNGSKKFSKFLMH